MRAEAVDAALVQNKDAVGVLHAGNTLGNDDLRRIRDLLAQGLANARVRRGIDRAGRIVEDEDLRLFQQGAGNAQALLLPAGDIGAALLDVGLIALAEWRE